MLNADDVGKKIGAALPGALVEVRDLTGTGDHFEARVVSDRFEGKSMVEQHQLVYASVQELMKTGALHALALKTYTPEQWTRLGRR